jgi:hypothetical protein
MFGSFPPTEEKINNNLDFNMDDDLMAQINKFATTQGAAGLNLNEAPSMPDISAAEERKEEDDPFADAFNEFSTGF